MSNLSIPEPDETSRQAAELEAFYRMLKISEGIFSISIAVCNSPALRTHLFKKITSKIEDIYILDVPSDCNNIYDVAMHTIPDHRCAAVFIYGMESLLDSTQSTHVILNILNASRELWKESFSCPVVFWLPEYAVTLLSQQARDFWSWCSHRFEFVAELVSPQMSILDHTSGDFALASNLSETEKQFRIAELQDRIESVNFASDKSMMRYVTIWTNELVFLQMTIGNLDDAERMQRKALTTDVKLGNLESMACDYGNLGLILMTRGDLEGAEAMYRKSLEINAKLGRFKGIANQYGNLGNVMQTRGDLNGAEVMYRKSLEINKKLGRLEGMASDYNNIGGFMLEYGDHDGAYEMFHKALKIDKQLSNQAGMALVYSNLAGIMQNRGDLSGAGIMVHKSLEINQKLGNLEGIASDYGNLAIIAKLRGNTEDARVLAIKARDLLAKIGMLHKVERIQGWIDRLAIISNNNSYIWLTTNSWSNE